MKTLYSLLEFFSVFKFDLFKSAKSFIKEILSDISMPNMSGLELVNTIFCINPKTFIIFQTTYSKHALDAFKSGGIDYLLKPISKKVVHSALKKLKI